MKKIFYLAFIFIIIGLNACIKSSLIGDDILKGDEIGVDFSDAITITATTVKNDSLQVFPNSGSSFLLGKFQNSIIGTATASLAMDFSVNSDISDTIDLSKLTVDSLVLTLAIDSLYNYGDSLSSHFIEVYELDENIQIKASDTAKFYSNYNFKIKPQLLGQKTIVPAHLDTLTVIEPTKDTTKYSQLVRIDLDKSLAQKFFADTSKLGSTELFKTMLKGIYIKSNTLTSSMIGISKYNSADVYTKIEVYYNISGNPKKLTYPISYLVPIFEHDYSSAEIKNYFDNSALSDSLVFIQGLNGARFNLEISGLDTLSDKTINKAELVFYTVDYSHNKTIPSRLIAFIENKDGTLSQIEDYTNSIYSSNDLYANGYPYDFDENGITGKKYRLNITSHLKALMKSGIYKTKLSIFPVNRLGNPSYAKFYGPGNSTLRTRINIVFSDKN
jgi:hypothetical protein